MRRADDNQDADFADLHSPEPVDHGDPCDGVLHAMSWPISDMIFIAIGS